MEPTGVEQRVATRTSTANSESGNASIEIEVSPEANCESLGRGEDKSSDDNNNNVVAQPALPLPQLAPPTMSNHLTQRATGQSHHSSNTSSSLSEQQCHYYNNSQAQLMLNHYYLYANQSNLFGQLLVPAAAAAAASLVAATFGSHPLGTRSFGHRSAIKNKTPKPKESKFAPCGQVNRQQQSRRRRRKRKRKHRSRGAKRRAVDDGETRTNNSAANGTNIFQPTETPSSSV